MGDKSGKRGRRSALRPATRANGSAAPKQGARTTQRGQSFEAAFDQAAEDLQHAHDSLRIPDPRPFLHVLSALVAIGRNHAHELPTMDEKLDDLRSERTPLANALLIGLSQMALTAGDRRRAASLVSEMTDDEHQELPVWILELGKTQIARAGVSADVWWEGSTAFLQLDVAGYPIR